MTSIQTTHSIQVPAPMGRINPEDLTGRFLLRMPISSNGSAVCQPELINHVQILFTAKGRLDNPERVLPYWYVSKIITLCQARSIVPICTKSELKSKFFDSFDSHTAYSITSPHPVYVKISKHMCVLLLRTPIQDGQTFKTATMVFHSLENLTGFSKFLNDFKKSAHTIDLFVIGNKALYFQLSKKLQQAIHRFNVSQKKASSSYAEIVHRETLCDMIIKDQMAYVSIDQLGNPLLIYTA